MEEDREWEKNGGKSQKEILIKNNADPKFSCGVLKTATKRATYLLRHPHPSTPQPPSPPDSNPGHEVIMGKTLGGKKGQYNKS